MLRLFRYNVEGQQSKIVAEGNIRCFYRYSSHQLYLKVFYEAVSSYHFLAHKDLGLLSLVISDTPGLEVCDPVGQLWFALYVSMTC
jgi:hypothetical protein